MNAVLGMKGNLNSFLLTEGLSGLLFIVKSLRL